MDSLDSAQSPHTHPQCCSCIPSDSGLQQCPKGTITDGDPELVGTVAHHGVIAVHHGATELTIGMTHDNCTTVIWNCKGSTSAAGPAACLLQLQSLHTCWSALQFVLCERAHAVSCGCERLHYHSTVCCTVPPIGEATVK